MGGIKLKRYIGRTLNLKNRISANLYIFDSPEETWENENLNKLDIGLKKTFDLQARFRTIQEGLGIVKENMELFKDLLAKPKQYNPRVGRDHPDPGGSSEYFYQEPEGIASANK